MTSPSARANQKMKAAAIAAPPAAPDGPRSQRFNPAAHEFIPLDPRAAARLLERVQARNLAAERLADLVNQSFDILGVPDGERGDITPDPNALPGAPLTLGLFRDKKPPAPAANGHAGPPQADAIPPAPGGSSDPPA